MGWLIGIDEAGYGPNLGPFVMTAVACQVSTGAPEVDLWELLRSAVRRAGEADDGRVLVADSKVVYSTARGLLGLERGVLATLWHPPAASLAGLLERACPSDPGGLPAEPWYRGTLALPAKAVPEEIAERAGSVARACMAAEVDGWQAHSAVICPAHFNELTDSAGTKAGVLAHALMRLLRRMRETLPGDQALSIVVDKHGGRNGYAAMVQDALPGGAVVVHEEGMSRSVYDVLGLGRDVRLNFQPRAEAACFCVALASMASKYLRELFMQEFNRFWQDQVPGLRPTAGYPGDAARFLDAIRPAAARLGIAEHTLWRRK